MVPQRIEREISIDAPLEVVWAVVTESQHISGWFSDSAAGRIVRIAVRPSSQTSTSELRLPSSG
jgi:uncharacterized protein YndB with AHSA1/START domain